MITGLALAAIVGFLLGLRCRAGMLLMSSMLVVLAVCAAEWDALLSGGDSFWAMMRVWLVLAAHQLAFVLGSSEALELKRHDGLPADLPADPQTSGCRTRSRLPGA